MLSTALGARSTALSKPPGRGPRGSSCQVEETDGEAGTVQCEDVEHGAHPGHRVG